MGVVVETEAVATEVAKETESIATEVTKETEVAKASETELAAEVVKETEDIATDVAKEAEVVAADTAAKTDTDTVVSEQIQTPETASTEKKPASKLWKLWSGDSDPK